MQWYRVLFVDGEPLNDHDLVREVEAILQTAERDPSIVGDKSEDPPRKRSSSSRGTPTSGTGREFKKQGGKMSQYVWNIFVCHT